MGKIPINYYWNISGMPQKDKKGGEQFMDSDGHIRGTKVNTISGSELLFR